MEKSINRYPRVVLCFGPSGNISDIQPIVNTDLENAFVQRSLQRLIKPTFIDSVKRFFREASR